MLHDIAIDPPPLGSNISLPTILIIVAVVAVLCILAVVLIRRTMRRK